MLPIIHQIVAAMPIALTTTNKQYLESAPRQQGYT